MARDSRNQGNGQGGVQIPWAGGTPEADESSHSYPRIIHKCTCTYCSHTHTQQVHKQDGTLNNHRTLMMLDSGASCSVVSKPHVCHMHILPTHNEISQCWWERYYTLWGSHDTVGLGKFLARHMFVVVDHLSIPVILGCDFLINHGYVLDFKRCTSHRAQNPEGVLQLLPTQTIPQPLHTITTGPDPQIKVWVGHYGTFETFQILCLVARQWRRNGFKGGGTNRGDGCMPLVHKNFRDFNYNILFLKMNYRPIIL